MISVILCTYNRDKYIFNVLQSIAKNNYAHDDYEIVLVNNNSTDRTEEECRRFQTEYPDIRFNYCVETQQGLSYARNTGIRQSKGDVLVYVDDDALVNEDYLATYARFFASHPDAVAAGGPILPEYETEEPSWMSHYTRQLITGKLYLGDRQKEFPKGAFPGGGNAAYRKSVFQKVGLFNVELGRKGDSLIGAEEKDLFDKMTSAGMHFYYLPTAILYHLIPEKKLTDDYFNRRTRSIGVSEYYRTRRISKGKYFKRLVSEGVKWGASCVLWVGFLFKLTPAKGNRIIRFRWNVTCGLLTGKTK